MAYDKELEVALEAAEMAGQAIMDHYERFEVVPDAPASISTDADRQGQEIILARLKRFFPDDALCAEESTATLAEASHFGPRLWIVDPIDGTRGFARKNGEFSVMIAFVDKGEVTVGVVLEPAKARLTYASLGQGCWKKDGDAEAVKSEVSAVTQLSEATLTRSRSKSESHDPRLKALGPKGLLETYSAGIKLALVARGEADLYLNTYRAFHDWDIAAGHILVLEAGGLATGLAGEQLTYGGNGNWQRHGLLATNRTLHEAALKALASVPSSGSK
ncbi:MAG: 3'(2'),5'-bisphosphate nucleotidase CysQ [Gemmataceae bacterium]